MDRILFNRTNNASRGEWFQFLLYEGASGSVLGPLLFLLFVNDLTDWIKTNVCIFADDTKIWTRITCVKDSESLQRDLDSLSRWSEKWLLCLNPEKCKVMYVRHSHKTSYTIRQDEKDWSLQSLTTLLLKANFLTSSLKPFLNSFWSCHLRKLPRRKI